MGSIRRVGFVNDSVIASELVKFLALNTEFDTIKKLVDENVKIRQECEDVKKDAKEATKSVSTLSNKLDDLKRYVEDTNKRLKTVESKQWCLQLGRKESSHKLSSPFGGTGETVVPLTHTAAQFKKFESSSIVVETGLIRQYKSLSIDLLFEDNPI